MLEWFCSLAEGQIRAHIETSGFTPLRRGVAQICAKDFLHPPDDMQQQTLFSTDKKCVYACMFLLRVVLGNKHRQRARQQWRWFCGDAGKR